MGAQTLMRGDRAKQATRNTCTASDKKLVQPKVRYRRSGHARRRINVLVLHVSLPSQQASMAAQSAPDPLVRSDPGNSR
jgi:hypothetical protein